MDASLARRIEVLESQVHRWKILTAVVLIGMTVLVVTAAAPPPQTQPTPDNGLIQQPAARSLTAYDFTLVGEDGKPQARLFTKGSEPVLEFYGLKGEVKWSAPPAIGFQPVVVEGRFQLTPGQ
jgi:hypothetical protein